MKKEKWAERTRAEAKIRERYLKVKDSQTERARRLFVVNEAKEKGSGPDPSVHSLDGCWFASGKWSSGCVGFDIAGPETQSLLDLEVECPFPRSSDAS